MAEVEHGLMHNCGHDVHAAVLLATARYVATHRELFVGKLVFLFQPAEETAGGADDIVREGVLDRLGVEKTFALHAAPGMPVGTIGISAGSTLAGSNYFTLTLKGRGSHAAAPFEGNDLPLVASHFVEALVQLPARRVDIANRPMVISVTKLRAEQSTSGLNRSSSKGDACSTNFSRPFASISSTDAVSLPAATIVIASGLSS
ncbi:MAG: M20/M25/M40 family metallo-hydrolase [Microvirga sp.]